MFWTVIATSAGARSNEGSGWERERFPDESGRGCLALLLRHVGPSSADREPNPTAGRRRRQRGRVRQRGGRGGRARRGPPPPGTLGSSRYLRCAEGGVRRRGRAVTGGVSFFFGGTGGINGWRWWGERR